MFHVVFLSPHSDPEANLSEPDSGGQCVYEHQLALTLASLPDMRVTIFCRNNFERDTITVVNNSYTIMRINCGHAKHIRKEEIAAVLPEFVEKVKKNLLELSENETIILHAHYWDGGLAALLLKSKWCTKLPLVWTPHSLGSEKKRNFLGSDHEWYYNFIPRQCWESYTAHIADRIIVSTDKERVALIQDYACDTEKIVICSPGIPSISLQPTNQQEARDTLGLPNSGKILLCLGRMVKNKGYHRSIAVLAALQKRYAGEVYLAIFSGGSQTKSDEELLYRERLVRDIEAANLQKYVIFKDSVPYHSVALVYSAADIFLMSSEHEPFGLVTIEAMAAGLPVIAHNSGGSQNIIQHTKNGILTDFSQPDKVAKYIVSFCKDAGLYADVSEAASKTARREYDWYAKSLTFNQVYRQISRSEPREPFKSRIAKVDLLQKYFPPNLYKSFGTTQARKVGELL